MTEQGPPTEDELRKNIDGSWHYSWHWERDRRYSFRPLTLRGWQQALQDAEGNLAQAEVAAHRLRNFIPRIRAEVEAQEEQAAVDARIDAEPSEAKP